MRKVFNANSAAIAAKQLGCKPNQVQLAVSGEYAVWVEIKNGKPTTKCVPVFTDCPDISGKPTILADGEFVSNREKERFYCYDRPKNRLRAVNLTSEKLVRTATQIYGAKMNLAHAKNRENDQFLFVWIIQKELENTSKIIPIFGNDADKLRDNKGKLIPHNKYEVRLLNLGQGVHKNDHFYTVMHSSKMGGLYLQ